MSDAIAKPSKRRGPDPREDAFLRFVNRVIDWATANLRAVLAGAVVVLLLAGATVWYVNYTQNLEEQAASQLQTLRAELAAGVDTIGAERLESFVDRFAGTEAGREAHVILGRLHLRNGEPERAAEAVEPAASQRPDTPLGYAGRMLLAKAQEAAGRTEEALRTLGEVAEDARFGFQRDEAAAQRARIYVETGRLERAESIYRRLSEEAASSGSRQLYAARLGEVQAMRETSATGGGTAEDATAGAS